MFNYVHLGEEILGQAQTKAGTERMTKKEKKISARRTSLFH